MADKLLEINNLIVHYETDSGVAEAINDITLSLERGETLGLVGETGAGKTSIALSIMGLLPTPPSNVISGSILFEGEDILKLREKEMRKLRGNKIGMIFQDPMTSLNPVFTVGKQISEVIQLHSKLPRAEVKEKAKQMLEMVGIPASRFDEYPHQFSGGMKQRVIIAIALACKPDLLIADEPTTALDVTIQAQVLEMMRDLQEQSGTSLILITHDFGVVADICKDCAVIYAGEIVEYGTIEHIFDNTSHPYTEGLFASLPKLDDKAERLKPIRGLMSDPMNLPSGCSFYSRCDYADERCEKESPPLVEVEKGHYTKCFYCERERRACNATTGAPATEEVL